MPIKEVLIENIGLVTISKNRRATRFKVTVRPNGIIRVTIPWLASFRAGEEFLSNHREWIEQTKEKLAKKVMPPNLIHAGQLFSTRNYHYEVCTANIPRLKNNYEEKEKRIIFQCPLNQPIESNEIQKKLKLAIENVLRFDAKQYLPVRITELASTLGYQFKKVTIKNNKTNWGSCSSRKNINLNLHLMRLTDRMIDYIIVHELVHTIIPNHGPQFKATMLNHFPDSSVLDQELKKIRTGID